MVAKRYEPWFNVGMDKNTAISLFGGQRETARALGISYQAVCKWPDVLPARIADRVLGAFARKYPNRIGELLEQPAAPQTEPAAEA